MTIKTEFCVEFVRKCTHSGFYCSYVKDSIRYNWPHIYTIYFQLPLTFSKSTVSPGERVTLDMGSKEAFYVLLDGLDDRLEEPRRFTTPVIYVCTIC